MKKASRDILPYIICDTISFPENEFTLPIVSLEAKKALDDANQLGKKILFLSPCEEDIEGNTCRSYGVLCHITKSYKMDFGYKAVFEVKDRVKISKLLSDNFAHYSIVKQRITQDILFKATSLMRICKDISARYFSYFSDKSASDVYQSLINIEDPESFSFFLAENVLLPSITKYVLLEGNLIERLELLYEYLQKECETIEFQANIKMKSQRELSKKQHLIQLQHEIKEIQKETGEFDDIQDLVDKLNQLTLPEKVRLKVDKELNRAKSMANYQSDYNVLRTWLETITELPWGDSEYSSINLAEVKNILSASHYGMRKVKQRIVEYVALQNRTQSQKGTIICLVGSPGVGKTSIAKSLAAALNREFITCSLGGVRDEAMIKGFRRTYVGAMPGRILNAFKGIKTNNPVFLLDEIDKMSFDANRGDPASALLDVLDPDHNSKFVDHYLDVEFDLSKTLFVTTANSLQHVPKPLLDRMEVIEIPSYSDKEKVFIGKKYLLPNQLKQHKITDEELRITDGCWSYLITNYTKEAGVRNLNRLVADICRKYVTKYSDKSITVTSKNLTKLLDPVSVKSEIIEENRVGVVNGLAWDSAGGSVLKIECNLLQNKKNRVTGSLGKVMKESVLVAQSCVEHSLPTLKHRKVHVHVGEGAVPKDGPSAGIGLAAAIYSAHKHIGISSTCGFTGEVTLKGDVIAIGGLREKLLAAKREGLKKVFLPQQNLLQAQEILLKEKLDLDINPVNNFMDIVNYLNDGES